MAAGDVTITTFEPAAYLRHIGKLTEGEVVIHDMTPRPPRIPAVAEIQAAVADHFAIPVREMKSARRSRDVARPRQVAMYLCRELTPKSMPEIGRRFGWRDHTTVIHAIRRVTSLMEQDVEFRDRVVTVATALLA